MATDVGDVLDTSDQRQAGGTGKVTLTLKIRRYNPELRGDESWWDEFTVEAEPNDRLLDALHTVKWYHDGTLALRRSRLTTAPATPGTASSACVTVLTQSSQVIRPTPRSMYLSPLSGRLSVVTVLLLGLHCRPGLFAGRYD